MEDGSKVRAGTALRKALETFRALCDQCIEEPERGGDEYMTCLAWVARCGLGEAEFRREVEAAPTEANRRGVEGIPVLLQDANCTVYRHAMLGCRTLVLYRAAAQVGREVGDRVMEQAAVCKISTLLWEEGMRSLWRQEFHQWLQQRVQMEVLLGNAVFILSARRLVMIRCIGIDGWYLSVL